MPKNNKCLAILYSPATQSIKWGYGPPSNEIINKYDEEGSLYLDREQCNLWVLKNGEYVNTGPLCTNGGSETSRGFIIEEGPPIDIEAPPETIYLDSVSGILYRKNDEWVKVASICEIMNNCPTIDDIVRRISDIEEELNNICDNIEECDAIIQIREEINELRTSLQNICGIIDQCDVIVSIESRLEGLENRLDDLNERMGGVEDGVSNLNTKVDDVEDYAKNIPITDAGTTGPDNDDDLPNGSIFINTSDGAIYKKNNGGYENVGTIGSEGCLNCSVEECDETTETLILDPSTSTTTADNVNIALVPKGEGAFQLDKDGNCRGQMAVDLQMKRDDPSSDEQVASGDYSVIGGGGGNVAQAQYSTIPGGEGLISNVDHMTTLGRFNRESNVTRPALLEPNLDRTKIAKDDGTWETPTDIGYLQDQTLFSLGYGESPSERRDVFLVNRKGVTWTRTAYTCSFGGDYAEEWDIDDKSEDPSYGDVMVVLKNGKVACYNEDNTDHTVDNIIGIVTPHPTIVGSLNYYKQELDPKTLKPINNSLDNNDILLDDDGEKKTMIGILGRLPIKKKYLKMTLPERWIIIEEPHIFKDKYPDYSMAIVR